MLNRRHLLTAAAAAVAAPAAAQTSSWPNRTVRLVLPVSAGGAADLCGRVLADQLKTVWGQPVVVDNKPGAGGNIAAGLVAKSAPDGYMILMAALSLVTAPFLVKNLGFDPMRDLMATR